MIVDEPASIDEDQEDFEEHVAVQALAFMVGFE